MTIDAIANTIRKHALGITVAGSLLVAGIAYNSYRQSDNPQYATLAGAQLAVTAVSVAACYAKKPE